MPAGFVLYPQTPRTQDLPMPEAAGFRVLLGIGDKEPTVWDGKVTVSEGRIGNPSKVGYGTIRAISRLNSSTSTSRLCRTAWTIS